MLKLIATLNQLNNEKHILEVITNENIYGVRLNTGVKLHTDKKSALIRLKQLCDFHKKELWIDIKGRQLRIISWADPLYESIKLNHSLSLNGKAKLYLRNDDIYDIQSVKNNEILLYDKPKKSVGAGQSVNIIPEQESELIIDEYLTKDDIEYLEICRELNINNIMASFVEDPLDIFKIREIHPSSKIICKIESKKGMYFAVKSYSQLKRYNLQIMAARDDLSIELGSSLSVELKTLIKLDSTAVCASKIFSSLKYNKYPDLVDFNDLELMCLYGYSNFMLDDNISEFAFSQAIDAWEYFIYKRKAKI